MQNIMAHTVMLAIQKAEIKESWSEASLRQKSTRLYQKSD
jgi:hypothetical protein